jgi:hypothetical protein
MGMIEIGGSSKIAAGLAAAERTVTGANVPGNGPD